MSPSPWTNLHSGSCRLSCESRSISSFWRRRKHNIGLGTPRGKLRCQNAADFNRHVGAIIETCRLVRQESLPVFYAGNSFSFIFPNTPLAWNILGHHLRVMDAGEAKAWLQSIGGENAGYVKSLTLEMGTFCAVPRTVRPPGVDTGWWSVAKKGAQRLRAAGLKADCDIRCHLSVNFSSTALYCDEGDRDIQSRNHFDLILPTRSSEAAVAEVERVVKERKRVCEAYAEHRCGVADSLSWALVNLERTRDILLCAITDQGQEMLEAKWWIYMVQCFADGGEEGRA